MTPYEPLKNNSKQIIYNLNIRNNSNISVNQNQNNNISRIHYSEFGKSHQTQDMNLINQFNQSNPLLNKQIKNETFSRFQNLNWHSNTNSNSQTSFLISNSGKTDSKGTHKNTSNSDVKYFETENKSKKDNLFQSTQFNKNQLMFNKNYNFSGNLKNKMEIISENQIVNNHSPKFVNENFKNNQENTNKPCQFKNIYQSPSKLKINESLSFSNKFGFHFIESQKNVDLDSNMSLLMKRDYNSMSKKDFQNQSGYMSIPLESSQFTQNQVDSSVLQFQNNDNKNKFINSNDVSLNFSHFKMNFQENNKYSHQNNSNSTKNIERMPQLKSKFSFHHNENKN